MIPIALGLSHIRQLQSQILVIFFTIDNFLDVIQEIEGCEHQFNLSLGVIQLKKVDQAFEENQYHLGDFPVKVNFDSF